MMTDAFSFLSRVNKRLPLSVSPMNILTPYPSVVGELHLRLKNQSLRAKIERHYGSSFPEYFKNPPHLFLARHVASPNFETLRFLHLVQSLGIPAIISQDSLDKFTSNNKIKHALGKLPILEGIRYKGNKYLESFKNLTIIDFNAADGKQLKEIKTCWNEPLISFHNNLFKQIAPRVPLEIHDEGQWLPSSLRGNPLEYYKYILPLFILHGILFEDYIEKDRDEMRFVKGVMVPAVKYVEKEFGFRPLIARLVPTSVESERFWISYPKKIGDIARDKIKTS